MPTRFGGLLASSPLRAGPAGRLQALTGAPGVRLTALAALFSSWATWGGRWTSAQSLAGRSADWQGWPGMSPGWGQSENGQARPQERAISPCKSAAQPGTVQGRSCHAAAAAAGSGLMPEVPGSRWWAGPSTVWRAGGAAAEPRVVGCRPALHRMGSPAVPKLTGCQGCRKAGQQGRRSAAPPAPSLPPTAPDSNLPPSAPDLSSRSGTGCQARAGSLA